MIWFSDRFENGDEKTGTWRLYPHQNRDRPALLLTATKSQPHKHSQHNTLRLTKSHDFSGPHEPVRSHDTMRRQGLQRQDSVSSQSSSTNQGKTHLRHYTLKPIAAKQNIPNSEQTVFVFPVAEPTTMNRKQLRHRESSPQSESHRHQTLNYRHSSPARSMAHLPTSPPQTNFNPPHTSTPIRAADQNRQTWNKPQGVSKSHSSATLHNRQRADSESNSHPQSVQEWFVWQTDTPDKQTAYRGESQRHRVRDNQKLAVRQTQNDGMPPQHISHGKAFTKHTGPEGQQQFINMMQPARVKSTNRGGASKPPMGPGPVGPAIRRPKTYHFERPEQFDDGVVYTEIRPQTQQVSRQGSSRGNQLRSRSNSPVIYTQVIPYDSPKPVQNSKPIYDDKRASMTFGDDLSVCDSEHGSIITLQNRAGSQSTLIDPHQIYNPKLSRESSRGSWLTAMRTNKGNKENRQHPQEYSVGLGVPNLQVIKPSRDADLNNNMIEKYDNVNSFPDEASLDRLMDNTDTSCDTTSTSTKTIKSALKSPRTKKVCYDKYF